jgi:hypothetical protein
LPITLFFMIPASDRKPHVSSPAVQVARPRRAFCSKEEQCTKTPFKRSKGDMDLYPIEVSVSYLDVCSSKFPKHASAAIWLWRRELPDLDGVIA